MLTDWLGSPQTVGWVTGFASIMTGWATFALWKATRQLVVATNTMADRTTQPHIVATIEPNQWSLNHLDLRVANVGHGAAYDIGLTFDPPLPNREGTRLLKAPLQNISVLRPGQLLASYVASFDQVKGTCYAVKITWKNKPDSSTQTSLSYPLDMNDYADVSNLGANDPQVQIAGQLKKLREDWRLIAQGSRAVRSDIFTSKDRAQKKKADHAAWESHKRKQAKLPASK
jgi:hypothetical protein